MTDKSWRSKALKIVGGVVKSPTNTVIYWWQSLVDVTELRRRTGQEHKVRCAMTWWCPSAQRETGSWWVVGSARCEGLGTLQGRWTSWTVDQARRRMPVLKVTISVGSAVWPIIIVTTSRVARSTGLTRSRTAAKCHRVSGHNASNFVAALSRLQLTATIEITGINAVFDLFHLNAMTRFTCICHCKQDL